MLGYAIINEEGGDNITHTYTAKYIQIPSGYMGQLIEWPEGKTIEKCREMLQDALNEMIAAYKQQKKEIPFGRVLFEQIPVEV